MILLNDALLKLVASRTVDPHVALQKTVDRDDLMKKLVAAGLAGSAASARGPANGALGARREGQAVLA